MGDLTRKEIETLYLLDDRGEIMIRDMFMGGICSTYWATKITERLIGKGLIEGRKEGRVSVFKMTEKGDEAIKSLRKLYKILLG